KADLTVLSAPQGDVKLSLSETASFPTKTDDEEAYLNLSLLLREADLQECFKLDSQILYREFFLKERLPRELLEKLRPFLIRKRRATLRTHYKGE
ncbi:MAG: hypothetical protein JSV44_05450, partial [Candidatus Zixiibacteriota bacterium]